MTLIGQPSPPTRRALPRSPASPPAADSSCGDHARKDGGQQLILRRIISCGSPAFEKYPRPARCPPPRRFPHTPRVENSVALRQGCALSHCQPEADRAAIARACASLLMGRSTLTVTQSYQQPSWRASSGLPHWNNHEETGRREGYAHNQSVTEGHLNTGCPDRSSLINPFSSSVTVAVTVEFTSARGSLSQLARALDRRHCFPV